MTKLYTYHTSYAFPTSIAALHRAAEAWSQASLLRLFSSSTKHHPALSPSSLLPSLQQSHSEKKKASLASLPLELMALIEDELVQGCLELYDSKLDARRQCTCADVEQTPAFWRNYVVRQGLEEFCHEELLTSASREEQHAAFERDGYYWPKACVAFRRAYWWQCEVCTSEEETFWSQLKDLRVDHPDEKVRTAGIQIGDMLRAHGLTPVVPADEPCTVGAAASPIHISLLDPMHLHTTSIQLLPLPCLPTSLLMDDPAFGLAAEKIMAVERFREAFGMVSVVQGGKRAEGDEMRVRMVEVV